MARSAIAFYRYRGELGPVLLTYLDQVRSHGMRAHVKCVDHAAMQTLQAALWKQYGTRFIGLGASGGDHDADQPVLLCSTDMPGNDPDCLIAIGTATADLDVLARFRKVAIVFAADIDSETAHARHLWKTLDDAGYPLRYFAQNAGGWDLKVSRNC